MTEKKLETVHVTEITEFRSRFAANSSDIAAAEKEIYALNRQIDSINDFKSKKLEEYLEIAKFETALLEKLKNHYGDGEINLEKGVFISQD